MSVLTYSCIILLLCSNVHIPHIHINIHTYTYHVIRYICTRAYIHKCMSTCILTHLYICTVHIDPQVELENNAKSLAWYEGHTGYYVRTSLYVCMQVGAFFICMYGGSLVQYVKHTGCYLCSSFYVCMQVGEISRICY